MNENIKTLLDKVSEDEALLAKFSACKSVDEAYELAKELVGGFTKEEFTEAMAALSAADGADISDQDLAAAAGGEDLPTSVKQYADGTYAFGTVFIKASESVADSATVVSNSVAQSATAVSNSIAKSAAAVSNSIIDSVGAVVNSKGTGTVSKVVGSAVKSVSKVSKALAV